MFEFTYGHVKDVDAYLARISCGGTKEPSLENLHRLVLCHQRSVPFENLDQVYGKKTVSLDPGALYEKIVENRRGGYCFELNGLFVLLLRDLGYDARSVMCRVQFGGETLNRVMHRGCLVRFGDELCFCDVGFGGPMAPFAVRVSEEEQTLFGETYFVSPLSSPHWYMLWRRRGVGYAEDGERKEEVHTVVAFTTAEFLNEDFKPMNEVCSGFFSNRLNVSVRTPDGYRALNGNVYTVCNKKEGRSDTVLAEPEVLPCLRDEFGLVP